MTQKRFFLPLIAYILLTASCIIPCNALSSGFYETLEMGRPPSVFSVCCCTKDEQTTTQATYTCHYIEEPVCPENTKQYNVNSFECPSELIFTKYNN